MDTPLLKTDFDTIMQYAYEACHKFNRKEICSEVLLYAITDDMNSAGYEALVSAGYKVSTLKAKLTKKFKEGIYAHTGKDKQISNAVEGLLALHTISYGSQPVNSLRLIVSIIRASNTAAARILRSERISLDYKNEIIYKPLIP